MRRLNSARSSATPFMAEYPVSESGGTFLALHASNALYIPQEDVSSCVLDSPSNFEMSCGVLMSSLTLFISMWITSTNFLNAPAALPRHSLPSESMSFPQPLMSGSHSSSHVTTPSSWSFALPNEKELTMSVFADEVPFTRGSSAL